MKRKFLLPLAAFALCFSVSFSAAGCDASGGKNDTKDDDKREEIPLDTALPTDRNCTAYAI